MFAPTPPLAASRWLCSEVASQGTEGLGELRLMTLDFSKAFLYGDVRREIYIELPPEDSRKGAADLIGLLRKSMYGLRDAPQIWQEVVREMLRLRGFVALVGTQCTYVHPQSGMTIVAHVDDFLVLGRRDELVKFLEGLQVEFECSGQILGYEPGDVQEFKFLGRWIRLTDSGIEWEGDPKHADHFLEKLLKYFSGVGDDGEGLVASLKRTSSMKGSKTPGIKQVSAGEERIGMTPTLAKSYRALAALGNYMSLDRVDIPFSSKEVSKTMSDPAICDLPALRRLGRYLVDHPRCVTVTSGSTPRSLPMATVTATGVEIKLPDVQRRADVYFEDLICSYTGRELNKLFR